MSENQHSHVQESLQQNDKTKKEVMMSIQEKPQDEPEMIQKHFSEKEEEIEVVEEVIEEVDEEEAEELDEEEGEEDEENDDEEDDDEEDEEEDKEEQQEYVVIDLASIRKEIECPICLGIIRNTSTVMECLHRFCRECIHKSMRLGRKECPTCRVHCPSRRSLRDDPSYDALIQVLCADIDKFEKEDS